MNKIFIILALFTINDIAAFAQQAYEGSIRYKKMDQPALVIIYNYSKDIIDNAVKAKLADMRLQSSNTKGFLVYNNAVIPEITPSSLDYSFKIQASGKMGSEQTIIYMIMEGNTVAGDPSDLSSKGKSFLENLSLNIKRSNAITQIKKQENILAIEEQKFQDLKEKNIKLKEQLKENEDKQHAQTKIITSQRDILDDLKNN